MSSPTFILTTSPFAKDEIPLASLIPNRKNPNEDIFVPYKVEETDYSRTVDKNFDATITGHSSTSFETLLASILATVFHIEYDSTFHMTADEGFMYTLKQPKRIFQDMLNNGEDTKA